MRLYRTLKPILEDEFGEKSNIFTKESLSKVEKAYSFLIVFSSFMERELGKSSKVYFGDLNNRLGIDVLKESLEDAIKSIKMSK